MLGCLLAGASAARASCAAADPPQVVWSYPEAGATDVPTHAVFWAVTKLGATRPRAMLDGQPLTVEDAGAFGGVRMQPEPLAPSSDHVLVLDFGATHPEARLEIPFRTAAEAASAELQAPVVSGHALREGKPAEHACADVVNAQDCFDTGQNTFLSFQVAQPPDTVGWTISGDGRAVWPARCGDPTLYTHTLSQPTSRVCYQLRRIAAGGQLSPPVEHCIEPGPRPAGAGGGSAAQAPSAADSGCAAVGAAADGTACALLALLLWTRRKRRGGE